MAIYYDHIIPTGENDHILGIYRLDWGTLVPDDDFGKITLYKVFIGCTGVPWYLMMILGK